jgi:hypothetical protein
MMSFYPPNSAAATYSGCKIVDVPADKAAYAFSGDDYAREVGRRLETNLREFNFSRIRNELERVADDTYADEKNKRSLTDVHRVLLVVFYCEKPELWKVDIKDGASRAQEVREFIAGDYGNTARFFKERYWRENHQRSLEELKLLAAHIILMGGDKIKRAGIEGLDIAVITRKEGFVRLCDDEISKLEKSSEELDRLIQSRLFDASSGLGVSR